tara:strand:- start:23 stop:541 length:519 start_codon:yes stop_codon:yes gene_type:complete
MSRRRLEKELKYIKDNKSYTVQLTETDGDLFVRAKIPLEKISKVALVENIKIPSTYPFDAPDLYVVNIRLLSTPGYKLIAEIRGKQAISQLLMRKGIIDPENADEVSAFHRLFTTEDWGPTLGLEYLVEHTIMGILEKYVLLFSKKRNREEEDDLAAAIELSKGTYFKILKF